jgi:hypothetical protein
MEASPSNLRNGRVTRDDGGDQVVGLPHNRPSRGQRIDVPEAQFYPLGDSGGGCDDLTVACDPDMLKFAGFRGIRRRSLDPGSLDCPPPRN